MENNLNIHDSNDMFERAIKHGFLSLEKTDNNYVGHYMYMGTSTDNNTVYFKHYDTREYIKVPVNKIQ